MAPRTLLPLAGLPLALAAAGCLGQLPTSASKAPGLPPPPPWPPPADMKAAVLAAGLDPLPVEGSVLHIHAHLDVYYQGKPVVVPRGLGIGPGDSFFSELHTHDSSGVVHVESPVRKNFTLGEFFKEWGVSLDGAMVYFDGKAPGIAPADVVLEDHDEIVVVFGPPPARIFTGFDWTTYWAGGPPVAM